MDQQRMRKLEPHTQAVRLVATQQAARSDSEAAESGRCPVRGGRPGTPWLRRLRVTSGVRTPLPDAQRLEPDDCCSESQSPGWAIHIDNTHLTV